MDVRQTWTNFDKSGDYVVPNVLRPRDLVSRPENMVETVYTFFLLNICHKSTKKHARPLWSVQL